MKRKSATYAGVLSSSFVLTAHAIPTLQLGIENGIYDTVTQTILAPGNPFNLFAYLIPDTNNTLSDTYRLSIALVPKTGPTHTNLGSFTIDNTTVVNVTADMTYGVPPIETVATQSSDPGDLADHGIFDTFFYELSFSFNSADQSAPFNTADNPADDPSDHPGTGMYFHKFVINTALLNPDYVLHFDLYNAKICTDDKGQCSVEGDVDVSEFAPFSHDAQSIPPLPPPPPQPAPEPGILWLMATGLLSLRFWTKKG